MSKITRTLDQRHTAVAEQVRAGDWTVHLAGRPQHVLKLVRIRQGGRRWAVIDCTATSQSMLATRYTLTDAIFEAAVILGTRWTSERIRGGQR